MAKPEQVVIIGCGAIGASIAYKLSQSASLQVTVLEANSQAGQGATGASLGVLMAACSQKATGDLVTLRLASLRLYEQLIPQLERQTGLSIPNCAGILCLSQKIGSESKWQSLIGKRQQQGFDLQFFDRDHVRSKYPFLSAQSALYSPSDRALHPSMLVQALVKAATLNGAKFIYDRKVDRLADIPDADKIVITAGLGSDRLRQSLDLDLDLDRPSNLLAPVGGQAILVELPDVSLNAVIHAEAANGEDINIVPLGFDRYWIGATVEFEPDTLPRTSNISLLLDKAIEFCPAFAQAKIIETWAGYRPRPVSQRSPILGFLPSHPNVSIATGHYRNGVLMAPITAEIINDLILKGESDRPWQGFALKS